MKCHYCGAEVSAHEIFCRFCGTRQEVRPQPEPVAAAAFSEPTDIPTHVQPEEKKENPVFAPIVQPPETEPAPAPAEEPLFDFEKTRPVMPRLQLPTHRGLGKMFFLGILTLGIYPMVIWSRLVTELNITTSRYDGRRTVPFFGMVMLAPLTLGIYQLVWIHNLCQRIGDELKRRKIDYRFGTKDFWIWCFLMAILCGVFGGVGAAFVAEGVSGVIFWLLLAATVLTLIGPFVFVHKLMRSMNRINEDFNMVG